MRLFSGLFLIVLSFLAACAPVQTNAPMPSPSMVTLTLVPTRTPSPTAIPTSAPTRTPLPTAVPTNTPTPIPTATRVPVPGFTVSGKPLRLLGAFVPGWFWGEWSEAAADDLIRSSKKVGITVLHMMPPEFEPNKLGEYQESDLAHLDYVFNRASQEGIYIMLSFLQATNISVRPDSPYYHPGGIEGLIKNPQLREGFKKHMAAVVSRVNTMNGRRYRDDPTLLGWIIVEEILSAPWNYPNGTPNVTAAQMSVWVEEMAHYLKDLDSNHLVTVNTHAGIDTVREGDWITVLSVPSLDFIEFEDADARVLNTSSSLEAIHLRLFTVGKPVVIMISFTSGTFDQASICHDYVWQAQKIKEMIPPYLALGATGFTIFSRGTALQHTPPYDQCYNYTASNEVINQAMLDIAKQLGTRNTFPVPLEFVRIGR